MPAACRRESLTLAATLAATPLALLRGDRADDSSALLRNRRFDFADVFQLIDDHLDHTATLVNVDDFATTKHHGDLDLIPTGQEGPRLLDLEPDIMVSRFGSQADFFGPGVMDLAVVVLFALLVLVFAVVHDAANGRLLVGGHFHQVQATLLGNLHRLFGRQDTQLFAFIRDNTDGRDADLLVDPYVLLAVDCFFLSYERRSNRRGRATVKLQKVFATMRPRVNYFATVGAAKSGVPCVTAATAVSDSASRCGARAVWLRPSRTAPA